MFYLNRNTELTPALLQKMINKFRVNVEPKLNKNKNYYVHEYVLAINYFSVIVLISPMVMTGRNQNTKEEES